MRRNRWIFWRSSCSIRTKNGKRSGRKWRSGTQQRVERFQAALSFGWQTQFQAASARLAKQADVLAAMSPHAVLERGFAIVQNARGQVVRDADSLKQGQTLHVSFAHGASDVQVLSLQKQGDFFD